MDAKLDLKACAPRQVVPLICVPTWMTGGPGKGHIIAFMPLCPIEKGYTVIIDGEARDHYKRQPSLKAVKEMLAKHCPEFAK